MKLERRAPTGVSAMTVRPEQPELLTMSDAQWNLAVRYAADIYGGSRTTERYFSLAHRELLDEILAQAAHVAKLRADVARLTEEAKRLARERDTAVSQQPWRCF